MISEVYNEDCMIGMARYPDKFFDLAIVDPPYGLGKKLSGGHFEPKYGSKHLEWDKIIPDDSYFMELERVSKVQIIWGANYFPYLWSRGCRGFIFWDKENPLKNFSSGELAYTSLDHPARCVKIMHSGATGMSEKNRIHPTQKPVRLYKWILDNYAKISDKILDTHLGSGSSRIAAHDMGLDFYGWELDKEYFDTMQLRFNNHIKQAPLFTPEDVIQPEQINLL